MIIEANVSSETNRCQEHLLSLIHGVREKGRTGPYSMAEIKSILTSEIWCADSVKPWVSYKESCYERNSIYKDESIEILCLCWKPGQKSTIHDHVGSNCGVKVLEGVCREKFFTVVNESQLLVRESKKAISYNPGQITLSHPGSVHQLENPGESGLISLHVYSPPLGVMPEYKVT